MTSIKMTSIKMTSIKMTSIKTSHACSNRLFCPTAAVKETTPRHEQELQQAC